MEPVRSMEQQGSDFNLLEYLDLARKYMKLLILFAVIGILVGIGLWVLEPPQFRATAKLKLDPANRDVLSFGEAAPWAGLYYRSEYFNTEFQVMRSTAVINRVQEELGEEYLRNSAHQQPPTSSLMSTLKNFVTNNKSVTQEAHKVGVSRSNMRVSEIKKTNLVTLSYTAKTPELARDATNAWARAYIAHGIEEKFNSTNQALEFLEDQSKELRIEIDRLINQKSDLEKRSDSYKVSNDRLIQDDTVVKTNQSLIKAETDLANARSRYEKLNNSTSTQSIQVIQSARVERLTKALGEKRSTYENDLRIYKPQLPKMQQLKEEIATLEQRLSTVRNQVYRELLSDLKAEIQAQENTIAQLQKSLTSKKATSAVVRKELESTIRDMESKITVNRERLADIDQRKEYLNLSLKLSEIGRSGQSIIETATLPGAPFAPSFRRFALMGLILGLLLAGAIALVIELTDRKIYSTDTLEKLTGLPTLAVIPKIRPQFIRKVAVECRVKALAGIMGLVNKIDGQLASHTDVKRLTQLVRAELDERGEPEGNSEGQNKTLRKVAALADRSLNAGVQSNELSQISNIANFAHLLGQEQSLAVANSQKTKKPRWSFSEFVKKRRDRMLQEEEDAYAGNTNETERTGLRRITGCFTYLKPSSPFAEAYRHLRTNILLSRAEENKVLLLTSGLSGEGKTISSINLATAFAQLGKRVVLVDGDLRRPKLSQIFNLKEEHGLVHYLVGHGEEQFEYRDLFQNTIIPNLYVVTSGPKPPNPSELLASQRMRDLVLRMREDFDYIILDSSPCLLVTDACVLGHLADGAIFVTKAGRTNRDEAIRSVQILVSNQIRPLGALFNDLDRSKKISYSKYGYRYGYGYGSSYGYYQEHEA